MFVWTTPVQRWHTGMNYFSSTLFLVAKQQTKISFVTMLYLRAVIFFTEYNLLADIGLHKKRKQQC